MQFFYALICLIFIWNIVLTYLLFFPLHKKNKTELLNPSLGKLKLGLHRFDAFPDATGQLSFCLVIIDDQDSGVLITSLHTKTNTRMYSKSIKFGQVESGSLSQEEKLAMLKAI